jgi:hypothetical protein
LICENGGIVFLEICFNFILYQRSFFNLNKKNVNSTNGKGGNLTLLALKNNHSLLINSSSGIFIKVYWLQQSWRKISRHCYHYCVMFIKISEDLWSLSTSQTLGYILWFSLFSLKLNIFTFNYSNLLYAESPNFDVFSTFWYNPLTI